MESGSINPPLPVLGRISESSRGSEVAQQVEILIAEPGEWNLTSWTHMVERENKLSQAIL